MLNKQINKVTIKDIAERANVSLGTIDRVLHDRGEVKEETKKKVLAIVNELGYTPNLLAKSLASKKTSYIAVIIPDSSDNNPYWKQPLIGIKKASEEIRDFNTEIEIFPFDATLEDSFKIIVNKVLHAKPEAVVFNPIFKNASIEFVQNLDELNIPYVYMDVNLDVGNNIAFYGQESKKSGYAAGKIMYYGLKQESTILIVKLANNKAIPRHVNQREEGFRDFFNEDKICVKPKIISIEVDLLEPGEPYVSLVKVFKSEKNIKGIFVPNSRVYKVAEYLYANRLSDILLIGYDLIEDNRIFIKKEIIDFVICQKPEEQGYQSVMALFNYIHQLKIDKRINYSPIDIIMKENIDYYKKYE